MLYTRQETKINKGQEFFLKGQIFPSDWPEETSAKSWQHLVLYWGKYLLLCAAGHKWKRGLKGLSHEMDLAFLMTCMVSFRPKKRMGTFLKWSRCP
jgi:hypothetical protein